MGNRLTGLTVGFADSMFPIQCAALMELWLQQMGDFYEKPHFTMENFNFGSLWSGGWKLLDQSTKRHTLRQIWSNKSFGVCVSSVGLTLYDGE